jgi:hypothetical protein
MVQTKVGRYWQQAKGWFFRKVWPFQTKEGCQTKVSKMRPTCQSHTNPGSKLKTAVTGKVKPGSKAAKRRKSFCARSAGQMKKFPKAAKDPNSRLRQARRRWKC